MGMIFPIAIRAFPRSHDVARALDDYLADTSSGRLALFKTPSLEQAFAVERTCFDIDTGEYRDVPPAVAALARLRFEAAQEIERLIALLDVLDSDPDLEDDGDGTGFDRRLPYAGDHEDDEPNGGAIESYAGGTDWSPRFTSAERDECEPCCEDEGAQCDDEGERDDNGLADIAGRDEQLGGHMVGYNLYL
jgi:hypothetical protein